MACFVALTFKTAPVGPAGLSRGRTIKAGQSPGKPAERETQQCIPRMRPVINSGRQAPENRDFCLICNGSRLVYRKFTMLRNLLDRSCEEKQWVRKIA